MLGCCGRMRRCVRCGRRLKKSEKLRMCERCRRDTLRQFLSRVLEDIEEGQGERGG